MQCRCTSIVHTRKHKNSNFVTLWNVKIVRSITFIRCVSHLYHFYSQLKKSFFVHSSSLFRSLNSVFVLCISHQICIRNHFIQCAPPVQFNKIVFYVDCSHCLYDPSQTTPDENNLKKNQQKHVKPFFLNFLWFFLGVCT